MISFQLPRRFTHMVLRTLPLILFSHLFPGWLSAQSLPVNPRWLHQGWSAQWITCPGAPARDYSVCHFRRDFTLGRIPARFRIHVSADNRYVLFVNGHEIGRGPARGDLYQWNYETYDIAPLLRAGKNTLAAQVWNLGVYAPVAQISSRLGFLVQGDEDSAEVVNTGSSWKCIQDQAYAPCATRLEQELGTYIVTGPGDSVRADRYPWGWELPDYPDSGWDQATGVAAAAVPFGYGSDNLWTLVPSPIPQMEQRTQRLARIRRSGDFAISDSFQLGSRPLTIPAHSRVSILLDQGFETVAYPVLEVSGGKGSEVRMVYAEALADQQNHKGNRDSVSGKSIRGLYDVFLPDGRAHARFKPLWIRTYRYLQLDVITGPDSLVLEDLSGIYTGYPFVHEASFSSDDPSLEKIWEVGWRTARLCAGETYFDCPYYEQLQYEADTRIQALISLYNAGDDRLMRKAIHDFYDSRLPLGLTQGRYPSNRLQIIPPFSLWWISMLHDYWMNRRDDGLLRGYLGAMNTILDWYRAHLDSSVDLLGPMDWWNFVDWNNAFPGGVPDGATDGHSSVLTLQFAYTLRQASDLLAYFHQNTQAAADQALANRLTRSVYLRCFDSRRMEMANTPSRTSFSQHAGILAVLAGAIPATQEKQVMEKVIRDSSLSQATFYFRFYLTRAMVAAGMANQYESQLGPWKAMIAKGLSTFAETPGQTRSDCHGWSASPEYDFLATLCGITPASPGFRSVRIAPAPGALREINAVMPHPDGFIRVSLKRRGAHGIEARISLPALLRGTFIWEGHSIPLHGGDQTITL
ncbi:MAG TPA: family 78 glycoside hydrolase catalytic domain [Chitinophagaceae bacterium]|nr:family 78 glycoside hydrolase catalytic domain [Chitinophagaceae bacterium]